MYISQMHFVEGFAAGPNVDRRGRRYRPLSIHAACFFFFFPRATARVGISPIVRVRSSPHFLLFIHNFVVRRSRFFFSPHDAVFPPFFPTLFRTTKFMRQTWKNIKKNGKRQSRPTFSKTEDCENSYDGGHDECT